jgi:hypothetical protein
MTAPVVAARCRDLRQDFSPEDALKKVKCPIPLLRGDAYHHETWGLVGAIDDQDLERIVALVEDLQMVQISGGHEIHMLQPQRYIDEVLKFANKIETIGKLS